MKNQAAALLCISILTLLCIHPVTAELISLCVPFADVPLGLSPEECIEFMQREHGVTLVSVLTEEDRQIMNDKPSLIINQKIRAPFGAMTFLGLPVYVGFSFSQNKLNGIFVKFTDPDSFYSLEMTIEERRAKRREMADIYFMITDYIQESMGSLQDGTLSIYGRTRFDEVKSYHYPMIEDKADEVAIRRIIDAEENIVLSEFCGNVEINFKGYCQEWYEQTYHFISIYYDVNVYFGVDEHEKVLRPFWGRDGDYFEAVAE